VNQDGALRAARVLPGIAANAQDAAMPGPANTFLPLQAYRQQPSPEQVNGLRTPAALPATAQRIGSLASSLTSSITA
jgi:hypothetical protein